jgi:predicted nucleic acid-binding protein
MRLAVDANILIAELLRQRGRDLVQDGRLELSIAAIPASEAAHELRKRVAVMERAGKLTVEAGQAILSSALETMSRRVVLVPPADYIDEYDRARRRIPRDPEDWHTVALAITIDAAIWTLDADFLGCGIATWTTDTLLSYLTHEATEAADKE